MVDLPNTLKGIDAGQLRNMSKKDDTNSQGTMLEFLKPGEKQLNTADVKGQKKNDDEEMIVEEENQQKEKCEEHSSYSNQVQVDNTEKMKGVDIQREQHESVKKGLSIEIQMDPECDLGTCAGTIMHVTEILITQWTKNKMIDGVYDTNGGLMNKKHDDLDNWAMEPRIIKKKKHVTVETTLEVHTNASAYALCQNEKDYCESNNVKIGSKNTIMEHTKKWDF